jgi:hypothetical protein
MRHAAIQLILCVLAGLAANEMQAQFMLVEDTVGTQADYPLSNIAHISFSDGVMTIRLADNNSDAYALGSLRHLSFLDSLLLSDDNQNIAGDLIRIYPNPARDELKIDLSGAAQSYGTFNIMSLGGKLLKTQAIKASGIITLDISMLNDGIYICQFINKTGIFSVKMIKQ